MCPLVGIDWGTLDIDAPATASIGSGGAPGAAVSCSLGAVTVTDGRAALNASWIALVASTDFTTGGGTAGETTLASEAQYWSGLATGTTGTGTFTPGQVNSRSTS
jgi:hypothetical protein